MGVPTPSISTLASSCLNSSVDRFRDNLRPVDALGMINYDAVHASTPALVSGHQDRRGLEGLAIKPDGQTLFAVVQAPLAQEGPNNV